MPVGSAALPWWVDALFILIAVVILVTLIVLVTEIIRNIGAGRRADPAPTRSVQGVGRSEAAVTPGVAGSPEATPSPAAAGSPEVQASP